MNTPKKFRVWLPSLNKFGDDNSVFMDCYGKLYGVTRPSLVDDSRSIVNIGQFKEFDGYTIQWYTGCHDAYNKEIYEGDIVKYNNGDVIRIGYIQFMAGIFFLNFPDQTDEELGYLLVSNLKVIGNIFENPELLK